MDGLFVHAPEDLGAEVFHPVGVEVHDPELTQRFDVDDAGDEAVAPGHGVAEDMSLIVDDVRVPAADVERVLHLRVYVDGTHVGADHVDVVEVRVSAVLQQPRAARLWSCLRHRHGLARAVHDLRTVEGERPHRLRIFPVAAADGAQVADVSSAEDRVEGLDAVAEDLDPAVVDVVGRARPFSAPDVVLRRAMDHLALRRDDEQGVEETVRDHLGPARLALRHDVRLVVARQLSQTFRLRSRDVDEQLVCRGHVRNVEDLVRETGQRSLGEGDQLHRHVDADDRDGGVDGVLDDSQVPVDVASGADTVHDRRQADRQVRGDGQRSSGGAVSHVPHSFSVESRITPRCMADHPTMYPRSPRWMLIQPR